MLMLLSARSHNSMDSWQKSGSKGSWHKQHVMLWYLVRNRHLLVGLDCSQCLGHRHSLDLTATEHQKYQPLVHTNQLQLVLVVESLELQDFLESMMESGKKKKQGRMSLTTQIMPFRNSSSLFTCP